MSVVAERKALSHPVTWDIAAQSSESSSSALDSKCSKIMMPSNEVVYLSSEVQSSALRGESFSF